MLRTLRLPRTLRMLRTLYLPREDLSTSVAHPAKALITSVAYPAKALNTNTPVMGTGSCQHVLHHMRPFIVNFAYTTNALIISGAYPANTLRTSFAYPAMTFSTTSRAIALVGVRIIGMVYVSGNLATWYQ